MRHLTEKIVNKEHLFDSRFVKGFYTLGKVFHIPSLLSQIIVIGPGSYALLIAAPIPEWLKIFGATLITVVACFCLEGGYRSACLHYAWALKKKRATTFSGIVALFGMLVFGLLSCSSSWWSVIIGAENFTPEVKQAPTKVVDSLANINKSLITADYNNSIKLIQDTYKEEVATIKQKFKAKHSANKAKISRWKTKEKAENVKYTTQINRVNAAILSDDKIKSEQIAELTSSKKKKLTSLLSEKDAKISDIHTETIDDKALLKKGKEGKTAKRESLVWKVGYFGGGIIALFVILIGVSIFTYVDHLHKLNPNLEPIVPKNYFNSFNPLSIFISTIYQMASQKLVNRAIEFENNHYVKPKTRKNYLDKFVPDDGILLDIQGQGSSSPPTYYRSKSNSKIPPINSVNSMHTVGTIVPRRVKAIPPTKTPSIAPKNGAAIQLQNAIDFAGQKSAVTQLATESQQIPVMTNVIEFDMQNTTNSPTATAIAENPNIEGISQSDIPRAQSDNKSIGEHQFEINVEQKYAVHYHKISGEPIRFTREKCINMIGTLKGQIKKKKADASKARRNLKNAQKARNEKNIAKWQKTLTEKLISIESKEKDLAYYTSMHESLNALH